jgi:beta-galactosidase GanA
VGFNIIKIWPTWTWFNPEEGAFDFDELHEIMCACDELGLKVVVNPSLESAPYWLEQKYPDSRYVNALGNEMYLRGMQTQPAGGWPGLCLDHPEVRKQAGVFLTELARQLDRHESLLVWDCWNEPMIEPARGTRLWATQDERLFCYCPHTIAAFRRWLQQRYGTVAALNEAWERRFSDWEQIDPPRAHGTYADWLDWRRFIMDDMVEQLHFRYEALRAGDRHARPIMSHFTQLQTLPHGAQMEAIGKRQYTMHGTDPYRMAEACDMWATSLFPLGWGATPADAAQRLDLTRSSARGKEWWVSEIEGGGAAGTGLKTIDYMRPNNIRLWNWLCVAYGAKAILYWQLLSEVTGMEGRRWGLIDRNGRTTDRAHEAGRMARLINDQWDIIEEHRPEARVALLFDSDIPLMCFAMDGDEGPSVESHVGYYRAVWEADLKADTILPQHLLPEQYDVVIVPFCPLLVPETAALLRAFVEAGGLLIAESGFGMYDYHGMAHTVVPPYGLDEITGAEEEESYYTDANASEGMDEIQRGPWLSFSNPVEGNVRAHTYVTPLLLREGARSIGFYGEMTVGAYHQFGRGEVYYFGTNLGGAICRGDPVAKQIVRNLLMKRVSPTVVGGKLRPRWVSSGNDALLVVINEQKNAQTEVLVLPQGYGHPQDVLAEQEVTMDSNRLPVTVPAKDVAVFRLRQLK